MDYLEFTFKTAPTKEYHQDLLIHALAEAGFDTFEDTVSGFKAYIAAQNFDEQKMHEHIADLYKQFAFSYEKQHVEQQNWNEVWESNFEPVRIGKDVLVRASFHPEELGYTHQIVIDPKMAFGTGHHQTTTLMMQYLLETDVKDKSLLDMGAGTGILAILAAQRGAGYLVAIDHDDVCVESIRENSAQNGHLHIEAKLGSKEAIPDYRFDIILANINRNILLDQISAYAAGLKTGGLLFLSGFYAGDDVKALLAEANEQGLVFVSEKTTDSWSAIKLMK